MKRIRPIFHNVHVFKSAEPKLRKSTFANYNLESMKIIFECALNVSRGNIPLSACGKPKLRTYKNILQGRGQECISLRLAKGYKLERRFPSPGIVCYITHYYRTFIPSKLTMLHKMYLVSSELFESSLRQTSRLQKQIEYEIAAEWSR